MSVFKSLFDETTHNTRIWLLIVACFSLPIIGWLLSSYSSIDGYTISLLLMPIVFFVIAFLNKKDNTLVENGYISACIIVIAVYSILFFLIKIEAAQQYIFRFVLLSIFLVAIFITLMIRSLLSNKDAQRKCDTVDILFYILAIILSTSNIFCAGFMANDLYLRKQDGGKIGVYINNISSSYDFDSATTKNIFPKLNIEGSDKNEKIFSMLKNAVQHKENKNYFSDGINRIGNLDKKQTELLRAIIERLAEKDNGESFNMLLSDVLSYSIDKSYIERLQNMDLVKK